jgi:hypothetical protein
MKLKTITVIGWLLIAIEAAMAVLTVPFTNWEDLTKYSPEIIIAQCTVTPNPQGVILDGMILSEIKVLSVLKGETNRVATGLVSQYRPHQGQRLLFFSSNRNNLSHSNQAYTALQAYSIVPLGHDLVIDQLAEKSLEQQIQMIRRSRLEDLRRASEADAAAVAAKKSVFDELGSWLRNEEKKRLEQGLK